MRLRAALTRLVSELAQGDRAYAVPLRARIQDGIAIVGVEGELPIEDLARVEGVRIDGDLYRRIHGREARVRLLRIAGAASRGDVVLRVPVGAAGTHAARALVDLPRAAMRRFDVHAAEPGDRFPPEGYVHVFFDEEALLAEIDDAGLAVVSRRGSTFVLGHRRAAPVEHAEPFAAELARVVRVVRDVERIRLRASPQDAIATMRARGKEASERGPIGRARLRRAIGWIDAIMRPPNNCYRRTLVELALDAGAARETLVFGLDVGKTGHVAFEDREDVAFDVTFEVR